MRNDFRTALTTVVGLLIAIPAYAVLTDDPVGRITQVHTYSDHGNGDIIIKVESPAAACPGGYWIRPTDPGAKSTYANALAAFHAGSSVRVGGYSDQIWNGSVTPFCRLYYLTPVL
jgi:hypothetical protein